MAQRVIACRVAVPTVLHVHAASLDEPVPPPDVRLSLRSVGETLIEDEYVLSLVEAEDAATWLTAAARDPEVAHADEGDLGVIRETHESIEELAPRRLKLYGSRLGRMDDCEDVGIIVDAAAGPTGGAPCVRLVLVDDIVAYSLPPARALETAAALLAARDDLRDHPPTVVRDLTVGSLQGAASSGEARAVEVEVEGEINETGWPRVTLHIASDSSLPASCGDSWYLLDDEVTRIAELLRTAAVSAANGQDGPTGALTNYGPPADPWLVVAVAWPPFHQCSEASWVLMRFYDQLVRQSGSDGCLWLPPETAQALARNLATALEHAREHPPLIFRPTGDHVVADLRWE